MDRCLPLSRILRSKKAIPAILIALLVSAGCETSESDLIYSESLEAVESLQRAAEDFEFEIYGEWPSRVNNYVRVEAEDGLSYFDWRPTWREQSRPVEQQLSYAESTGRLTWAQHVDLKQRMSSVEAGIEVRANSYQRRTLERLEIHQESVLEWIETIEFDTSSKYLGLDGARDKVMASRFGRESGTLGRARSWSRIIAEDIFFCTDDHFAKWSQHLNQEVEWALWRRFASQKGLDVTLLSAYVDECDFTWLYEDPYSLVRANFGRRFPAEEYERIKDDLTRSTSRLASSDQQTANQQTPSPRPPQFTIKTLLSSDDGAKVLISQQKIGRRRSEHQLVQKGDLISLSGVEWTILDIDPENKSVVVKSVTSGVAHVITYDP